MSKGSIRLHPKFGVNPTVPVCVLCGKSKNEVVLLGAAYKNQAPMHMLLDVEPCDECRENYLSNGVMLIEADPKDLDDNYNPKPTGNVMVFTNEAFLRIFTVPIPPKKMCYLENVAFQKLYKEYKQETN